MEETVGKSDDISLDTTPIKSSKSWLQRLKEESWEAELLVSAIAIFGTFQLFAVVDWGTNKFIDVLDPSQYFIGYMIIFFGLFAISILVAMFVIHFFLRAYWIGLVGLNSVFPDYSIEDSVYSKIYTKKILSILPKLEDSIKKVDEMCSVIFSSAFTFLLMYAYMAFLASIYLLIFNMLSSYVSIYILLIPLGFMILALFTQMIISVLANLKANKEKVKLQTYSFKIVKFVSMLIYGPLYRPILQVSMIFGSNFKKKKSLVYLMFLFLISGVFVALAQFSETNIPYLVNKDRYFDATRVNSNYYETENEHNKFLLTPEIESDRITSKMLKVFIPIFSNEKKMRENSCVDYIEDENKSKVEQRQDRRSSYLKCYHKYNIVYINGIKTAVEYLKYDHPRTKQFGILGYIQLSNPKIGLNTITVKKEYNEQHIEEWSIPFYYSSN